MKKTWLSLICILFAGFCAGYFSPGLAAERQIDLRALLAKKVPILLVFGSNCCPSCQYSKPILDDLAKVYSGKAIVTGVDVAVDKDLARDFKIRLTPTQVFLTPDGKEFFRKEGNLQREETIQVFNKMGVAPAPQARAPISVPATPVVMSVPGNSAIPQPKNNQERNPGFLTDDLQWRSM